LTDDELARQLVVDTVWIESRFGIQERYIAGADETTHSLAHIRAHGVPPRPRLFFNLILSRLAIGSVRWRAIATSLELGPIAAFDVNAACSGGCVGLLSALSLLLSGLLIGSCLLRLTQAGGIRRRMTRERGYSLVRGF
jgi:3-oxoacyl-[acyl-carrier-protein] synthase-3